MPTKILVTGGAGYLGSILIPDLLNLGYQVTVVDNFMYRQASLNHICNLPNFQIINGDVRNNDLMKKLFQEADIIIPLAAYVGAPICKKDPVGAHSTNYEALVMMMKNVSSSQLILMPTTNSAYGSGDENNFCTEKSPLNPLSNYAIDKVEVEKILMNHKNAISFRLATVFGMSPRMRMDLLVNDFTYRAFKDRSIVLFEGYFRRNFIHVRDISRLFQFGISNSRQMAGEIFNAGLSNANLTKIELCKVIQNHIPELVYFDSLIGKDPDQRNYIVSNAKIESLGFIPTTSIDQGISELIKGYKMLNNNIYGNC